LLIIFLFSSFAFAKDNSPIEVRITSPTTIKDYPGLEQKIRTEITNTSNNDIHNIMAYITMADIKKHMTVNLEDYNADKPIIIGTLKPGEKTIIDLPVRLVYTSHYKLYVTVSSDEDNKLYSSDSIPVEIIGNSKISPMLVRIVAFAEPIIVAIILLIIIKKKRIPQL